MQIKVFGDVSQIEFDLVPVGQRALQSVAQVLFDVQMGEQSIVLKDESNAAPMTWHVDGIVLPCLFVEDQRTPAWHETCDRSQKRCFAAAAWSR